MVNYIIKNYNIRKNKIYKYKILPVFSQNKNSSKTTNKTGENKKIVYIWNINQNYWIDLHKINFPLEIFGDINNIDPITNKHIVVKSKIEYSTLINELSKYKFGLVEYSNNLKEYLKYWTWAKLVTYIIAGVPILVNENLEYPSYIVKKYNWLTYPNITDVSKIIKEINKKQYEEIKGNVIEFTKKVNNPQQYIKNFLFYF